MDIFQGSRNFLLRQFVPYLNKTASPCAFADGDDALKTVSQFAFFSCGLSRPPCFSCRFAAFWPRLVSNWKRVVLLCKTPRFTLQNRPFHYAVLPVSCRVLCRIVPLVVHFRKWRHYSPTAVRTPIMLWAPFVGCSAIFSLAFLFMQIRIFLAWGWCCESSAPLRFAWEPGGKCFFAFVFHSQ